MIAGHQEATRELWPKLTSNMSRMFQHSLRRGGKDDANQVQMQLASLKPFPMLDLKMLEVWRRRSLQAEECRGIPEDALPVFP